MEISYSLQKKEADYRSSLISTPLSYYLRLRFNEDTFSGYVKIDFSTKSISENLWIDYAGDSILTITLNNSSIQQVKKGNKFLMPKMNPGDYQLNIEFTSTYSTNGTGMHKYKDPEDDKTYFYSYMCPYYANKIFPCFDQPDLKAVFVISVEAQNNFSVFSNEYRDTVEEIENDFDLTLFKPTPPISTYILAIVCGEYEGINDVYARSSLSSYIPVTDILYWVTEGNKEYTSYFGIEMPFSKYTQIFCPEFNMGAMENAGCVTISDNQVWKEAPVKSEYNLLQNTVLHELCHMWFGNLVTLKWWDDLWLNESFATYFSYYITSKILSPDAWSSFLNNKMKAYSIDCLSSTHPVHVTNIDTQEAISNLDYITYWKGASLLKNLAFIIGETAFSEGLQRYFKKYAWKNVTLQDFVDSMQSPLLQKWIEEWVDAKGLNNIECELIVSESKITKAWITQKIVSGEILRTHSILVEGVNENGTVFKQKITIPAEPYSEIGELVGLNAEGIIFNSEDHGYIQVTLDEKSKTFFFGKGFIRFQSPLNRALIWQSLWNRVESLKFTSAEFIEIVSEFLIHEEEDDIIDMISSYSQAIINDYCPLSYIPKYSHMLFEAFMTKLKKTPKNKCLQRKIFLVANTNDDVSKAYNYSLTMARSEKWKGIMVLSSILSIQEVKELLKEELKNDKNDQAVLLTNYCESAAYDNKQAAWDLITNKNGFSMLQIDYAMRGFWQNKDLRCLKGFWKKYFEVLPEIVENNDREYAENFVRHMFPKHKNVNKLIQSLRSLSVKQAWVERFIQDTIQELEKIKVHLANFINN